MVVVVDGRPPEGCEVGSAVEDVPEQVADEAVLEEIALETGGRYYRATDVNRLNMIRHLQDLGLHLDRIRDLTLVPQARPD